MALIARQIKFRPKSVLSLPLDKKARHLAGLAQVSDLLAARLLISYHLEHQRPMMGAFLDALGIAHEDGLIKDEYAEGARRRRRSTRRVKALVGGVSEGRRRALFLGAALAGSRDLGRPEGPARTARSNSEPWPPFDKHLFICCNRREPGHSARLLRSDRLRSAAEGVQEGAGRARPEPPHPRQQVRAASISASTGPTVVVYPDGVWYGGVTEADVTEIVDEHIIGGRPVARLLMPEGDVDRQAALTNHGRIPDRRRTRSRSSR